MVPTTQSGGHHFGYSCRAGQDGLHVTLTVVEPQRADYWHGYRRGLRRARFGEQYGTAAEHQLWLTLADDTDSSRAARGRGYRDALAHGGRSVEPGVHLRIN